MKKSVLALVISFLLLASVAVWIFKGRDAGSVQEIVQAAVVLILAGFAGYFGVSRLRSRARHEPGEDELSRRVMLRASSLAFYISIYLWLFIMYMSDKTAMPAHSLIGAGIVGMALAFLLCWLGVRFFGLKNE